MILNQKRYVKISPAVSSDSIEVFLRNNFSLIPYIGVIELVNITLVET